MIMGELMKKLFDHIVTYFWIIFKFDFISGYYYFLKTFLFRKNEGFGKKIYFKYYERIKKVLKKQNLAKIDNYDSEQISETSTIWFLWWQGVREMPDIVRLSLQTIERHKGEHKLVVITKDNYKDFVSIPENIIQKLNSKKITITLFSDILRCNLLADHGGIWMDATLIMTGSFDKTIYSSRFFTIHHGLFSDFHVCKGLWTGFFLCSGKNNPLLVYMKDSFNQYFEKYSRSPCYLLIDCFLALAYENSCYFKNMIDRVSTNNCDLYFLDDHGNDLYDCQFWNRTSTYLFKMHYKRSFISKDENGNLTNWGYAFILSDKNN